MVLLAATLEAEIEALPSIDPSSPTALTDAINGWTDAYSTYFAESAVVIVGAEASGPLAVMETAMKGAMAGLNTDFPTAFQAGVTAWWTALVVPGVGALTWLAGGSPVVPPLLTVTPPPGLAGLAAAILATGLANKGANLDRANAASAMALTMHTPNLGGTISQLVPPTTLHPIT